jgi:regulator of replication initiation timing
VTDATLLKKVEELSARVVALETENIRVNRENSRLQTENRLLRQKLDQYIRHYFGGQRNEALGNEAAFWGSVTSWNSTGHEDEILWLD